jgi:thiamine biosynthesis lipoprotein ApbE
MYSNHSRFWQLAAIVPLAAVATTTSGQSSQLTGTDQQGLFRTHHEQVLGTSLEITLRASNAADAAKAEANVLAVFDQDEAQLSTWRADSGASIWAKTRFEPVKVSPQLFEVLASFDVWRTRTNGALDPSIEAATQLWNRATVEGRVPTEQEIALAVEAMQQPHWALDRANGTATRLSDVPLALASFTKSYITSRAAEAALKAGATGVTLNVGGDVVVRGNITQVVSIADPQAATENDAALDHVIVRDRAVATSGSYRRGFELASALRSSAPRFSHLIDPRTANPAHHVISSTVIARDAVTAGALATALSVMPEEEGQTLTASMPDVSYFLVLASGEQVRSANWPQSPGLHNAAFQPSMAKTATPAVAGLWNPAFELSLDITLPRIEDARYRRPYVAVWVEDADHFPVRTLALWFQNPRWLPDLKQWYRDDQLRNLSEGTDISRTISSATRPPGSYTLKWDGKDNAGKLVKAGKYTLCIEAAREHGGYDILRHEISADSKPQQATLPAVKELGVVTLDYRKR